MSERNFTPGIDVALVGEIEARRELAAEGWLTINTNTEKGNFPNVDLFAAKGEESQAIQVKTTNAEKGSHKDNLFMGRAEGWLTNEIPFFNAKLGPLTANIVILVHARRKGSRFVVLPVSVAEQIARFAVERWYAVPKLNGDKRSAGFDARLPFTRLKKNPHPTDPFLQETLLTYVDRWDVLGESIEKLKDQAAWGIEFPGQHHK
jgi:hypothetical protein